MSDKYEKIQNISLDLIDEPGVDIRSRIDQTGLDELAADIKLHGLIQPILLRPRGDRFEIVAGHRRFLAVKSLGVLTISAIVRDIDDAGADIIKLSENFYREDVNIVDEANFFAGIISRYNLTIQKLAEMIHRSDTYIEARLNIINWDTLIQQFLYEDKIGFTVAQYLARIDNQDIRRNWLDIAVRCGITVEQARSWWEQYQKGILPFKPSEQAVVEIEKGGLGVVIEKECAICGEKGRIEEMIVVFVHKDCEEYARYQRKFGPVGKQP